jgi:tetratricopeptide (TPR) repeat protein
MRKSGRVVVLFLSVGALVAGCGGGSGKSQSQRALEALDAGLKAQVAGHYGTARRAYKDVLATDANNKFAYYNLGLIAQTEQRGADAEAGYRRAIGIDPNFVPALFNLAILRTDAKAGAEAVNLYRRIISIDERQAGAHLNLGFVLRSTGQEGAGNIEIARALQLDPSLARRDAPVAGGASPNG